MESLQPVFMKRHAGGECGLLKECGVASSRASKFLDEVAAGWGRHTVARSASDVAPVAAHGVIEAEHGAPQM